MRKLSILAAVSVASTAFLAAGQALAITYQTPPATTSYQNGTTSNATSIKTDSMGNMIVSVTSSGDNGKIIKYAPNGQTVWTVDFDPNNPRPADRMENFVTGTGISAVTVDRNDNIYAVGESYNGVSLDCLLKKYNTSNGALIWQTRFSVPQSDTTTKDQYCHDVTVDKSGDIIAGGTSLSFTGLAYDGYSNQILKWDASGKLIGQFNVTTNGIEACGATPCQSQIMKVAVDLDQNIYTIAKYGGIFSNWSYFSRFSKDLVKLSSPYVASYSFSPTALAVDTQGHVYGGGYETAYNPLGVDVYRKMNVLDSNLNQLCEDKRFMASIMTYADPAPYGFNAVVIGPDEKAYLAGSQDKNFAAMEYDAQCQPQWVDADGNPALLKAQLEYSDFSNAVTLDNNNNLIIAGKYLKSDRVTTGAATVKFAPVVTPTLSDLGITGLFSALTFRTGQVLNTGGYVRNHSTGTTGDAVWLGIYLSTDSIINRQDTLLCRTSVAALGASETQPFGCTGGTLPVTLPTGTYYFGAIADDGNLIVETNETNNTAANQVQFTALPDLVAVSGSAPATANNGQQITVTATIKNQGAGAATTGSTAGIYISSDSTISASDKLVCTTAVGALAPGASQNISCTAAIPMDTYGGNVYIGVLADSSNVVEESNEANNYYSQSLNLTALSDLVISSAVSPATAQGGNQIIVSGTVTNQGYGPTGLPTTGYYWVSMYLSQDNVITTTDTLLCTVGFATTPVNTTLPFSCSATIPTTISAGNYYVGFFADRSNSVPESNETNNIKVNSIAITQLPPPPPALPDMIASILNAPTSANAGQQITVMSSIKNQGLGAATTTSTARIYISSDSIITTSDTLLCTAAVGTLAAGASQIVSCTGTIPMNIYGGNVYVGVLADSTNTVAETNEANNGGSKAFNLIALPDLVTLSAVSPATAQRGTQITVSGTVKNQGYGPSTGFFQYIKLSQNIYFDSLATVLCTVGIGAIPANGTVPFSCSGTIPATLAAGNYYIGFVSDTGNFVAESNETNNITVNSVAITL